MMLMLMVVMVMVNTDVQYLWYPFAIENNKAENF